MDEVDNSSPQDPEAEMNEMFNQSILDVGSGNIGRLSITHTTDESLDFSHATESTDVTQSSDNTSKIRADMRTSSMRGKRATATDVSLEDFDIKMQLG